MDLTRAGKISRICQAMPHYYGRLRKARELRAELLQDDCGSRYPGNETTLGDVINLLQEGRIALALSLVSYSPRWLARTHSADRAVRTFAQKGGRMLNSWSPRIRMQQSLQTCAQEAFFSLGIGKTCSADGPPVAVEIDNYIQPGRPFFAPRTLDHFGWDLDATDFRYCSVLFDRYRACYYDLQEEKRIKEHIRNKLFTWGPDMPSPEALGEHTAKLSESYSEHAQVEPWLWLSDCYDPKNRMVYTFLVDDLMEPRIDEPLYETEWTGRPEGPFHFLNLGYVPSHTVTSSPGQNLSNLHNFANMLYRKLREQAERAKQVTASGAGDEEDAERMRLVKDGGHVTLNNLEIAKTLRLDGPDQNLYVLLQDVISKFDRAGGNIQMRLGLGPQSETARQDAMTSSANSRLEAYYQLNFVDFVREVGREQWRMLYQDAATEIPGSVDVNGYTAPDDWMGALEPGARPAQRDPVTGEALFDEQTGLPMTLPFDVIDIDLDPYSMQYKSPGQRIAEITARVQELLPLEPLLNQRGMGLNIKKYLDYIGQYSDLNELSEIYDYNLPPANPETQPAMLGSAGGPHEYTHRNVSDSAGQQPQLTMQAYADQ